MFFVDVLSGASDFPMSADLKIFLKQLMAIGRQTDVWFVSGGVQEGIVQYLGESLPSLFASAYPLVYFVRQSGWARERFGGHIPLIGIASWARVEHKDELAVKEGLLNLGYDTKLPVKYIMHSETRQQHHRRGWHRASTRPDTKGRFLDPNHSHFILVVRTALTSLLSLPVCPSPVPSSLPSTPDHRPSQVSSAPPPPIDSH